jgi:hypothetical protein
MYSTIRFGTASKATPQGRHLYRAGVGVELAIKQLPARCLDHQATTSPTKCKLLDFFVCTKFTWFTPILHQFYTKFAYHPGFFLGKSPG